MCIVQYAHKHNLHSLCVCMSMCDIEVYVDKLHGMYEYVCAKVQPHWGSPLPPDHDVSLNNSFLSSLFLSLFLLYEHGHKPLIYHSFCSFHYIMCMCISYTHISYAIYCMRYWRWRNNTFALCLYIDINVQLEGDYACIILYII